MRRVLVTGGSGFLGGATARRLAAAGWAVTVTGRDPRRTAATGLPHLLGDLSDAGFADLAAQGQDAIVHCAALSAPWGRYADFLAANVLATRHLLAAARAHGVRRVVHISSASVYAGGDRLLGIDEDDRLPDRPINHYAATKRLAEAEALAAAGTALHVVILRPQAIFGPGDTVIMPRLLKANAATGIPLIGSGRHLLDITYVDNVADAAALALTAGAETNGRIYNISNGEPVRLDVMLSDVCARIGVTPRFRHLPLRPARLLAATLELGHRLTRSPREPALTRYSVDVLARDRTLSIARARRELGYSPRVSVEEGVRRYAAWWLDQNSPSAPAARQEASLDPADHRA